MEVMRENRIRSTQCHQDSLLPNDRIQTLRGCLKNRFFRDWERMESWTSPHQLEFTEGSRMFRVVRPVPELDGEAVDN